MSVSSGHEDICVPVVGGREDIRVSVFGGREDVWVAALFSDEDILGVRFGRRRGNLCVRSRRHEDDWVVLLLGRGCFARIYARLLAVGEGAKRRAAYCLTFDPFGRDHF